MIDQNLIEKAKRAWQNEQYSHHHWWPGSVECNAFHAGIKEGIRLANEAAQPIVSNLEMMIGGGVEESK
jgi:hypothetical protein